MLALGTWRNALQVFPVKRLPLGPSKICCSSMFILFCSITEPLATRAYSCPRASSWQSIGFKRITRDDGQKQESHPKPELFSSFQFCQTSCIIWNPLAGGSLLWLAKFHPTRAAETVSSNWIEGLQNKAMDGFTTVQHCSPWMNWIEWQDPLFHW